MRKLQRILGPVALMVGSLIGLVRFAESFKSSNNLREGISRPTFVMDSELAVVLAPRELVEFAKAHRSIDVFEDLSVQLKKEHHGEIWYVAVMVDTMNTGLKQRSVSYVYPAKMAYRFPTTKAVLQSIGSEPITPHASKKTTPKIVIIPPEYSKQPSSALVEDLVEKAL